MKSRYSSPMSTNTPLRRRMRRGFTLIEVGVAGSICLLILSVMVSLLSLSNRIMQTTLLSTTADQTATGAMDQMILDIREAKQVTIVAPNRIQIYYPIIAANGQYDRTKLDSTHYIEYKETNASGTLTTGGGYLWRKTESSTGIAVQKNISQFTASSFADDAVRLTVDTDVVQGSVHGITRLDQRIIYLRNY